MGDLIRAEWRRLFTRRITWVMLALVVAVLALVVFAVGSRSHPHTPQTLARAQDFIAGQRAQNLDLCLTEAREGTIEPGQTEPPTEAGCQEAARSFNPPVDEFQGFQFRFSSDIGTMVFLFSGLLALLGFVVGASSIGAEWSTGGMAMLLVWRPRRLQVLVGKLAALLLGVTAMTVGTSLAWIGALWSVARLRGDATGIDGGLLSSLAIRDLRGLALALACATAGFAMASFGRHTAAALGAAVAYVVVDEVVLRILLTASGITRPQRYFLTSYVFAWLDQTTSYPDTSPCVLAGSCRASTWSISLAQGGAVIGAIVAVTLAAGVYALRRRDIT